MAAAAKAMEANWLLDAPCEHEVAVLACWSSAAACCSLARQGKDLKADPDAACGWAEELQDGAEDAQAGRHSVGRRDDAMHEARRSAEEEEAAREAIVITRKTPGKRSSTDLQPTPAPPWGSAIAQTWSDGRPGLHLGVNCAAQGPAADTSAA